MLTSELLSPAVLDHPVTCTPFDALIEQVKHHPALEAE
jgi:hypothetical protein